VLGLVTLSLIITWVESYVALGVAYVMLGFGGSRWTREYVNRYICLMISVGLKILTIYGVITPKPIWRFRDPSRRGWCGEVPGCVFLGICRKRRGAAVD
jgi:hypothetical protein